MPNSNFWSEPFPDESIDKGKQLLEQLHWNIKVQRSGNTWSIHAGHQLLMKTSSEEAVEAMLYGMALSYAVIPDNILQQFRQHVDRAAR